MSMISYPERCQFVNPANGQVHTWICTRPATWGGQWSWGCYVCNSAGKDTAFGRVEVESRKMLQLSSFQARQPNILCFFPKRDCNVSLLLGPLLCLQLFKSGLALVRMFPRMKYAPSTVRQSPVTIRIFPGHLSDNQMIASLSEGCPSPFHDLRNARSQLSSVEMLPMWKIWRWRHILVISMFLVVCYRMFSLCPATPGRNR